jgi:hypothetical protein
MSKTKPSTRQFLCKRHWIIAEDLSMSSQAE